MADDLSKRGGSDRKRIDVGQEHELRAWSEKFGVTQDQLKKAVAAVERPKGPRGAARMPSRDAQLT